MCQEHRYDKEEMVSNRSVDLFVGHLPPDARAASHCTGHRAGALLSGSAVANSLAAGDASFADAEVAVREATNALLELAARLPDR